MNYKQKCIVSLSVLGLFGPFLGFIGSSSQSDTIASLSVILWPTWLLGWFVMGKDQLTASTIIAISIAINVVIFGIVGWTLSRFKFKKKLLNYVMLLPVYGVLYGAVSLIILSFE